MHKQDTKSWYKDAVIYQAHVRSFKDSNGDGIGDFKGLIEKLDYLKSLGVTAIWILPFYKSPLKDGGYDIADFTHIHEDYGTMADFKRFIREAHNRDLRVITELVLNHTSSDHKWFQRARNAKPGSVYRDFYVWNETPDKYNDARIIFQDFEISNWSWDPVAKAYYWHRFYSHQPDLNYDNPSVHKAVFKVLDFWFKIGIDGLRLDAVPYLYEREGTNCENLPETHAFLKKLRKYIDENYEDKMLLAEANQWPDDASEYFGKGDECHMSFHFPLMPRLYMSMRMEDRFPLIDILEQTPDIPANCQWAIFLRNHDELTLEMVSDEERDYMYKSFAQNPKQRINLGIRRRLAPLLDNDRKNIELMNILLFSMPGTPIVYYGDEIGMGDNYYLGDRDGVRTPMQWSADRNAGFSSAEPQRLFLPIIFNHDYHYETVNVENHEKNPTSLLWWMRRVIAKRKQYRAFSRGDIQFIDTSNSKILAFTRTYNDEKILVIINLSRYSQQAELDLSEYEGYVPTEVFSQNKFAIIGEDPYIFPMQFKNYFWFELRKQEEDEVIETLSPDHQLVLSSKEWNKMQGTTRNSLEKLMRSYVRKNRWFRGKAKKIKAIDIKNTIPFSTGNLNSYIVIIETKYIEGKPEQYVIPISIKTGEIIADVKFKHPEAMIAYVEVDGHEGVMYDGSYNQEVRDIFLQLITQKGMLKTRKGSIVGVPGKKMRSKVKKSELPLNSRVLLAEQSNTSILYDNRFFFKMYRSPEEGNNPELEIIKTLTENTRFRNFPTFAGALEYREPNAESSALGILVDFVHNEGNAWEFIQSSIDRYFDRIIEDKEYLMSDKPIDSTTDLVEHVGEEKMRDLLGPFFIEMIELLGKRTAEMHLALASVESKKEFKPEPFSLLYQKSLYQSFRTLIKRTLNDMKSSKRKLNEEQIALIDDIIDNESLLLSTIKHTLEKKKIHTSKTRVHGDYHLGQVLFTGKDFVIIDFEGEPTRSLTARKLKHCPFKDVAGMLRSFHYAIYMGQLENQSKIPESADLLNPWLEAWYEIVRKTFIDSYLETAGDASFIPKEEREINDLLSVYTIEKAIYEADYEFNNRPDWLHIPLNGLKKILDDLVE
ncbi:maltose alpha-D-glucosyltransferase/ alpha-amylase [Tangfeifania diversioriginum]|uniref:maltose alpha-D-glucosyltransferase n=1 Tax=Tangfeifania diversioriginum TaxID=1168035 RepID=A0A1M6IQE7_9BACT|nr:maltose alpha-D-glucosyltransferase [Tangfeifania diversioriginum]SHJ36706.1 maltose alpha-D-glucosyltransferase/ alpha-amylase [Tangfeifania diversioriginum]